MIALTGNNNNYKNKTMTSATFNNWLETFLDEKGVDMEQILTVPGPSGDNHMPVSILVDAIKQAPLHEQAGIKNMIVRIDFVNRDVIRYFRHLAQAIAI